MNPVENQTVNSDFKITALSGPENACESVLKSLKVQDLPILLKKHHFQLMYHLGRNLQAEAMKIILKLLIP